MKDSKFKTLRHIETVRNYLNLIIKELIDRQEHHDQTKLQPPELEYFDKHTPELRGLTYGSEEYKNIMEKMRPAIDHHNTINRHHPEYFYDLVECSCGERYSNLDVSFCTVCHSSINDMTRKYIKRGINCVTLPDIIEMLCDWKAAGLRHNNGNIFDSIEINAERFGISDQLKEILINTAKWMNEKNVFHRAEES